MAELVTMVIQTNQIAIGAGIIGCAAFIVASIALVVAAFR